MTDITINGWHYPAKLTTIPPIARPIIRAQLADDAETKMDLMTGTADRWQLSQTAPAWQDIADLLTRAGAVHPAAIATMERSYYQALADACPR